MIIGIECQAYWRCLTGKPLTFEKLNHTADQLYSKYDPERFTSVLCAKLGYKELPLSKGYADYLIDLDEQCVIVTPHIFPEMLDGAKVLYFTEKGTFEPIYGSGGAVAKKVCYLAICKIENDFCLFHIDENLNVVADGCLKNMDACEKYMDTQGVTWYAHKKDNT